MKVKELIAQLNRVDQELEVFICDEIEGNDSYLTGIELSWAFDHLNTKENIDVLMLRWNMPKEKSK